MNGEGYPEAKPPRHGSSREYRDERRERGDRDRNRDRDRGDREHDRDRDHRRRRSRSPRQGRGGAGAGAGGSGGSSRRDYEVDTYSSSRDFREREREDRYARDHHRRPDEPRGGDPRGAGGGAGIPSGPGGGGIGATGGGGWERDRGARRDRRDDERRRPERDHDDRRRGGGGGGGGPPRGPGAGHDGRGDRRPRSASPPPKRKEPTPDLTDIVSVLERKRRLTQWDMKPPGYEQVTAEQAKLSGMFPLPGAPRQQQMDTTRLQAFLNQPGAQASVTALKPSQARQSKRLFAYNIPPSATDASLVEFFNLQLNGLNVISSSEPCLSALLSKEKGYAMLEFRTPEDATVALALDGIEMEASSADTNGVSNGKQKGLQIKRPQDYIAPTSSEEDTPMQDGYVSNHVNDSPNKISVTQIPVHWSDEQITELLVTFGKLKAFSVVKDTGSEQSRGIAFAEYADPASTDIAVEGLNNMPLGDDRQLRVQRASIGSQQAAGLEMSVAAMSMLAGSSSSDLHEGRVLQLLNMVTADELMDNEEYEEICADVHEECSKYGKVLELKIPRPTGTRANPGVGKIFVKFENKAAATEALRALAGRKFSDRTVVVTFFGEEYFDVNAW